MFAWDARGMVTWKLVWQHWTWWWWVNCLAPVCLWLRHFLCLGTTSLLLSLKTHWCCKTIVTCKGLWTGEKVFFAFHTQLRKERGRRELEEKSRKLRNESLHPARRKSKRAWKVSRRWTHVKFEGLGEKKSPPPQVSRNPRVLSLKDGEGWDEW